MIAKISFLEIELNAAKEKIQLIEGSSMWSTSRKEYDWIGPKGFSSFKTSARLKILTRVTRWVGAIKLLSFNK